MDDRQKKLDEETKAYLDRIKRTISESEALMQGVELRIQETDRLLESQGLTRQQIESLQVTPEQRRLVNEELKRRGLPPLEDEPEEYPAASLPDERLTGHGRAADPNLDAGDVKEDLENRKRKFNVMMNKIKL